MITFKTNHGDFQVKLFDDKAPVTCENFRQYVEDEFFNGTIFHRFGYAVFGEVIDGMDVVDKIAGVQTGNLGGHQDVPVETVEIISVSSKAAAD